MLFALYYLLPVSFRDLWQPDELRYAEISREMIASGNWIVPHFFDLRYFEKPIAGYWVNSIGQLLFGHSNFAVRAGAIFSTLCSGALMFWLGRRMFNSRTGLLASTIFLTSLLVYGVGTYAVLDPILLLWLTAAICSFWYADQAVTTRQRLTGYLLLGIACGMGFMTKGFLALAVPVLAIVPWMLWQRRFAELLRWGPLAVLVAALLSLPWALAISRQEGDFWHYFFWIEHIQRFADNDAQHKAPFWYYLPVLAAGTLPWLGLLPGALITGWRQRHQHAQALYLLSWVIFPLLFFSIAKGKLLTYILPCFVPLALLIAHYAQGSGAGLSRAVRINGWINVVFGAAATLAVLLFLAPWGLARRPLYGSDEIRHIIFAVLVFLGWAAAGAVSLRSGRWQLAALCPLALALLVGLAIPDAVRDAKQPQNFVTNLGQRLSQSRFIVADNPGVASALAWQLQRSDIYFYANQGELRYGLNYPDAQSRFIADGDFAEWLRLQRRVGSVALVMMLDSHQKTPDVSLPVPDEFRLQGRLLYYGYNATP